MKKNLQFIVWICAIVCMLSYNALAYNPASFYDEEEITVNGNRPKVDISTSEFTVTVAVEDFIDGIARKSVKIINEGNVPCYLNVEVGNVPIDLNTTAELMDESLSRGQSTELIITIELTDQQEEDSFTFDITVTATLRP